MALWCKKTDEKLWSSDKNLCRNIMNGKINLKSLPEQRYPIRKSCHWRTPPGVSAPGVVSEEMVASMAVADAAVKTDVARI